MTHSVRRHLAVLRAGLILLGCLTLPWGCASERVLAHLRYQNREKALSLIDEGQGLEKEGNPGLALDRYNRALAIYESPEAYFKMGRIFEAQGKNQEAATAYTQALRVAPDYQEARMAILALGFTPPGVAPTKEDLTKATQWAAKRNPELEHLRLKPRPADPVTSETAKSAEEIASEREQAIATTEKNRKPTPEEVREALFSAEAADQAKLPSATKPNYTSDQDVILGSYSYHYQKAEQLRARQQYDKAAEEYERALQADPKQIQARLDLGDMMMRVDRSERARLHYERALTDFPDSPRPLLKMGNYCLELKQPDKAREYYRKSLDKDPQYVEAYNNLAVLDMQERKFKESAKLLDEIITLDPTYSNAYLNRGIIASDIEHDRAAAVRYYKKYVELNGPRSAQVRRWITEMENPE